MADIIKSDVRIDNSGREYDLGRAYYTTVFLKVLTRDEAVSAFQSGKRVYFIYQNNRIYHTHCRKVCKDLEYLKEHYPDWDEKKLTYSKWDFLKGGNV